MEKLSNNLKIFIKNSTWTFAKTYAKTWPHEYIVQEQVNNRLFSKLANHIDFHGYTDYFYDKEMIFFKYKDFVYWHMDNVINRCVVADTYSQRKRDGRLPSI